MKKNRHCYIDLSLESENGTFTDFSRDMLIMLFNIL